MFRSHSRKKSRHYWVDSRVALCWIKNEKPWKQYVQNRVQEIRSLSAKEAWRHCPGSQNPADLPSRGLTANDLATNSMWWNGPEFLQRKENEWPPIQTRQSIDESALKELVKQQPEVTHSLVNSEGNPSEADLNNIIDCDRFSDF